jgi:rubrerythrin
MLKTKDLAIWEMCHFREFAEIYRNTAKTAFNAKCGFLYFQ